MKKVVAILLCLTLLLTLFGCSGGSGGASTASPADSGSEAASPADSGAPASTDDSGDKITLKMLRLGSEEAFKPIFDPIVANFEQEHNNIDVDFSVMGWSEAATKLRLLAASEDLPDVTFINIINGYALAHEGYLKNLKPLFEADADLQADFPPSLIQAATFEEGLYWMPAAVGAFSMWYRKDLLEEAGLDPNSPPQTWEDVITYGKQITEKTGVPAFGFGAKSSSEETADFVYSLYSSYTGVPIWDPASRSFTIGQGNNRELFKQALEMMYGIVNESGIIPPNPSEYNCREFANSLYNKECAMIIDGVWAGKTFKEELDKGADSVIAATTFPAGPAGSNAIVGVDGWAMAESTKHPEEAWTLLKYLINEENQAAHSSQYGLLPMLNSMQGRPEFSNPHWAELTKQLETAVPRPQDYQISMVSLHVSDAFASYMLGRMTVDEAIDYMIDSVAAELE